jgi:DNA adenine methylase
MHRLSRLLGEYGDRQDVMFFIDPPYTVGGKKAGHRLYRYCEIDHERLFQICETLAGDFLMTYDNAEEPKAMARRHGFEMKPVAMTNTHHAEMTELLIGRNLGWLDEVECVRETPLPYRCKRQRRETAR